jgi:putative ABC transport system permease protein
MDTLIQDLRQAARRLRRSPGFTLVAVLTLALGIGGNAAVLTALEALLLRPLPYPEPERLVLVRQTDERILERPVSPANFLDWRERTRSFEGLAAYEVVARTLLGRETPLRVAVGVVSGNFLALLGVPPAHGRGFGPSDEGAREAVLTDTLWRSQFGSDPGVVGRDLQFDGELVRVVGVMPPGPTFPREAELYLRAKHDVPEMPIAPEIDPRPVRDARYLVVLGRLRPGVALASARAEMELVATALAAEHPADNEGNGASVAPLFEELRGGARPALLLLLAAAGCVLLIACANVANLLLARSVSRRHELALRAALGASALRLSRQPLMEALLLAALGGGAGLALGWAARPLMLAFWPASLPPLEGLHLSAPVLAASSLLSLACVVVVGLVPARQAARADALAGLRSASRLPLAGREAHRARAALVVAEVAVAVVLVSGAGLLLNSLWRLSRQPLGFESAGVLTAKLNLPRGLGNDAVALRAAVDRLEERLRALPGVGAAGVGQRLPLSGAGISAGLRVEGREARPNEQLDAGWRIVTPGWFETLRVPLLRGRGFDARDRAEAPGVALVNATLARQAFGDADPVGRRVATGLDGPEGTWLTIVGVVADTPQENVAKAARPEMYRPLAQDVRMAPSALTVALRAGVPPGSLGAAVQREVAAVRGDLAVTEVRPLAEIARESIAAPRVASGVLGVFAALALFLACLGLYGVVSCLVGERTHELGVRLSLGAQPASLVSLVLGRSLALAGAGLALGLAAALALARLLEGVLFGVGPRDPFTLGAVAIVLLVAAAAAAWAPARRAARLDPAVVLRSD